MPAIKLHINELQDAVNAIAEHGSLQAAAQALGMSRTTLQSRVLKASAKQLQATYRRPYAALSGRGSVVAHIPDLHAPFMHQDAPAFIAAVLKRFAPTVVVLAGDELDQHSISEHPVDPNGYSPGHELEAGLAQLQGVYDLIPEAKVCVSNHGSRPYRRAFKAGLPSQYLKDYAQFMRAPAGWEWADSFEIDGVVYSHGEAATGANGALQLAIRMGKSQAVGHWHGNAGASYFYNGTSLVFGLYSGCLIDEAAYAFKYGKHAKLKPVLGMSIIDHGVPTFIPMRTRAGRWVGVL